LPERNGNDGPRVRALDPVIRERLNRTRDLAAFVGEDALAGAACLIGVAMNAYGPRSAQHRGFTLASCSSSLV
jgi:hypothetical protein